MRTILSGLILAVLIPAAPLRAADWQPAKGPLMTRWAKDVTPDKVHPEYPRPQMVRKEWQNLNGLWQFAAAQRGVKNEAPPSARSWTGKSWCRSRSSRRCPA